MAKRLSLRDRFFTPRVARAIMSPLGIVLAGAGAAVGIVAGLPILGAAAIGAAAWGTRVAAAVPRNPTQARVDPFALREPWRRWVQAALSAQSRFEQAVKRSKPGPLRDRLREIGDRMGTGVEECWRVAQRGQEMADARAQIDDRETQRELTQLVQSTNGPWGADTPTQHTIESLQAQLESVRRMDALINDTGARLRLLDARLDEAVARAIELSVRAEDVTDLGGLGDDVDHLVGEMEALRQGLEEAGGAAANRRRFVTDPALEPTGSRLIRSSAAVGAGTALSRITGLLRVGAIGYALGTLRLADAYNTANNTPNIVYELLLGGILSATLVPVFVGCFERDDDDGVAAVVSVSIVALAAITTTAILAAPWLFRAYTWRSSPAEAHALAEVGVPLLRLFLPQIFFYGLTALGTALLNARRRFAAPAFVPVLNNIAVCIALVTFARAAGRRPTLEQVHNDAGLLWLLGAGTTAGIVAMTVALWPAIRRAGIRLRWRFRPRDAAVQKVVRLSGWTMGYVAANQIALAVVIALALRHPGDQAAYTYAFVFFQLPHGLFAVSLMTTFVPDLAADAAREDLPAFRDQFGLGLRLLLLVIVPAAAGYALIARPLVTMLLARGALDVADAQRVADTLAAFAAGLVGYSVYLFCLRAFYAMQDTRTPFVLNAGENAINIVLAFALVGSLRVQGLALAYSAAYTVAAAAAFIALTHRAGAFDVRRIGATAVKVVAATAAMAAVVWLVRESVGDDTGGGAAVRALAAVAAGAVTYVAAVFALRVEELANLRQRGGEARSDS